jgi:hypothetical protein
MKGDVSRWSDPWKVARAGGPGGRDGEKSRSSRSRLPIGGRLLLAGALTLTTLVATMSVASAASSTWKLTSGSAKASSPDLATFNFTVSDKAHLLYNRKDGALLGNQLNSTMSASATVAGVNGTFTYGGEPSCGNTTATVRLFFESVPKGSTFAYTNYWWSGSGEQILAGNGTVTLSALVDPEVVVGGPWFDLNGQNSGSSNAAAFDAAASNVTAVGLSFGGSCSFESGVGTSDGSGTFSLGTFAS